MTPELFAQLAAQGYNRIPVKKQVLADTETPLSTYLKLARGPYSYLFESVQGGEKWGRYSMIGLPAQMRIEAAGRQLRVLSGTAVLEEHELDDPLAFVEAFAARYRVAELPEHPRFQGGLVGYFGYDVVRYIEPRLAASQPPDTVGTPDVLLLVSEEVVVFDNLSGMLTLIVHADPAQPDALQQAYRRLDALQAQLGQSLPVLPPMGTAPVSDLRRSSEQRFVSQFGKAPFLAAVERIQDYILAGDIMQAVLAQRFSLPFTAEPINLYRALRSINPSPYLYFLDLGDHHIVGSSPEILARLEQGELTVRPIAGTRKRGSTPQEDQALELDLLADPKEIAEHLMLIDLGRNDVGRVAQTGSVKLTEKMVIERFSHVMHITSNVTGQLRPELSAMDALRAAHPAGTLSGAPKIRAMEILDTLEPAKRGIYGGAVGYLSWNGNMDTAIAIRTAVIKNGQIHVMAGAGVVADSVPEMEWQETLNKARALFRAVDMLTE